MFSASLPCQLFGKQVVKTGYTVRNRYLEYESVWTSEEDVVTRSSIRQSLYATLTVCSSVCQSLCPV